MGSRWESYRAKVTAVCLSHLGRSSDRVCGYRRCVLSGKAVIPTPVWSPSTVAYSVVDVLHFLHWDQSFIGINFHWDRIHWDQDYSGIKFHWDRNSIGIEFIGRKFHWEQFRWEQTSMGLKRSAHAKLSLLSHWLATTGTTA